MKISILVLMVFFVSLFLMHCTASKEKIEDITVAYFPGWPCTFEIGWSKGWFEKNMGVKVNFREFDTGAQMTAVMASGDVQISYSLGLIPFASAVTQGVPIKAVGIADSYSEVENIVIRNGTDITSPKDLIGKIVGVPYGTTSHYKLMGILEKSGIKQTQLKLIDMAPQDIVAAFKRADIHAGIAWEPFYSEMLKNGHLIVSVEEIEQWGYSTFDVVAVTDQFAETNPHLVSTFLKVVDDSTLFFKKQPDESYKLIGQKAGLKPDKAEAILNGMTFYTVEEQLQPVWMGTTGEQGEIVRKIKKVADFLVKQKSIDRALDNYAHVVDPSFLEAIKQR
jgi:taurine transport system substrate-binding protein